MTMVDQDANTEGVTEGLDAASNAAELRERQSLAEEVGLPSATGTTEASNGETRTADVTELLKKIKLPERSEFRAAADSLPVQPAAVAQTEVTIPAPPDPKPRDIVSAVHTLKDDFQSAVQDQKVSLVQAAALQEEKRARQASEPTMNRVAQQKNSLKTIVMVLAFVALGVIALGASLILMREQANVTPSTFLVEGLLFSEQTVPLPIGNIAAGDLKRQLGMARASEGLTLGAITRIAPTVEEQGPDGASVPREATTGEFLEALDAHVPEELLRALGSEFFFGFHTVDENAPLLIIPITSYERAFAGMLQWEKMINADLSPFFTNLPSLVRQSDGLLVERVFTDSVMRNFDVRVLKDDAGTVQLYYSFPTRTVLIIAESPYSFAEILSRLRADRKL